MTEQEAKGVVSAAADLGTKLITTLPPAFVLLVLINVMFIAAVLWFMSHETDQKLVVINKILDTCTTVLQQERTILEHHQ